MIKILFVCLGNICRSPAAEGIMRRKLIDKRMVDGEDFIIDSAGTGGYWNGAHPDERSQQVCQTHDLDISKQISRSLIPSDGEEFDHIYCMDESNLQRAQEIIPDKYQGKVHLINASGIGDPYRLGQEGFEIMYSELDRAIDEIISSIVG